MPAKTLNTVCRNGHRRTPKNTYHGPSSGKRACKVCKAKAQTQYRSTLARRRRDEKWTAEDVRHFVRCADINLDNLLVSTPVLKEHPLFKLVKQQLRWALHGEEAEKEDNG